MAVPLFPGKQQFLDRLGVALALGTVGHYVPGTLTPKQTWQDSGQSVLNSNPITLDAAGYAQIYGSGLYRQIVKDPLGNTIWDQVAEAVDVEADLAETTGAGHIGASQALTYPQATLGDHYKRFICVTDAPYNAKGDGSTDDTAAFTAALADMTGIGGTLWAPAGTYKITSLLSVPPGVALQGSGWTTSSAQTIRTPATCLVNAGTGFTVLLVNDVTGTGSAQVVKNIGFIGSNTAAGAVQVGSGTTAGIQNGLSHLENITISGFTATNAVALYAPSTQRCVMRNFIIGGNYTNIKLGGNGSNVNLYDGNVSSNNVNGKAIDATVTDPFGVQFISVNTYYESCPGQTPFDLQAQGTYRFYGRGMENLCQAGATTVNNPCPFSISGLAVLDIDVDNLDYLSSGDNFSGTISFLKTGDGSRFRIRAQNVTMNYGGAGRAGVVYKFFTAVGYAAFGQFSFKRVGGSGFANLQAVMQAYSTLGSFTPSPFDISSDGVEYFDINTGHQYIDYCTPNAIALPRSTSGSAATGPLATQTDAGTTTYSIILGDPGSTSVWPTGWFSGARELAFTISGRRSGTAGAKTATFNIVSGGTTTKNISLGATTADSWSAKISLYWTARLEQILTVDYFDGTSAGTNSYVLNLDNLTNTLQFQVALTNASAGDSMFLDKVLVNRK